MDASGGHNEIDESCSAPDSAALPQLFSTEMREALETLATAWDVRLHRGSRMLPHASSPKSNVERQNHDQLPSLKTQSVSVSSHAFASVSNREGIQTILRFLRSSIPQAQITALQNRKIELSASDLAGAVPTSVKMIDLPSQEERERDWTGLSSRVSIASFENVQLMEFHADAAELDSGWTRLAAKLHFSASIFLVMIQLSAAAAAAAPPESQAKAAMPNAENIADPLASGQDSEFKNTAESTAARATSATSERPLQWGRVNERDAVADAIDNAILTCSRLFQASRSIPLELCPAELVVHVELVVDLLERLQKRVSTSSAATCFRFEEQEKITCQLLWSACILRWDTLVRETIVLLARSLLNASAPLRAKFSEKEVPSGFALGSESNANGCKRKVRFEFDGESSAKELNQDSEFLLQSNPNVSFDVDNAALDDDAGDRIDRDREQAMQLERHRIRMRGHVHLEGENVRKRDEYGIFCHRQAAAACAADNEFEHDHEDEIACSQKPGRGTGKETSIFQVRGLVHASSSGARDHDHMHACAHDAYDREFDNCNQTAGAMAEIKTSDRNAYENIDFNVDVNVHDHEFERNDYADRDRDELIAIAMAPSKDSLEKANAFQMSFAHDHDFGDHDRFQLQDVDSNLNSGSRAELSQLRLSR